jgi:hypothetical protein
MPPSIAKVTPCQTVGKKQGSQDLIFLLPLSQVLQSIWSDPLFEKEYAFQRVNVENKEFAMKLDTADM